MKKYLIALLLIVGMGCRDKTHYDIPKVRVDIPKMYFDEDAGVSNIKDASKHVSFVAGKDYKRTPNGIELKPVTIGLGGSENTSDKISYNSPTFPGTATSASTDLKHYWDKIDTIKVDMLCTYKEEGSQQFYKSGYAIIKNKCVKTHTVDEWGGRWDDVQLAIGITYHTECDYQAIPLKYLDAAKDSLPPNIIVWSTKP